MLTTKTRTFSLRFKTRNTYKRHLRTRHGKKLTTKGFIHSVTEDAGSTVISSNVTSSNVEQQHLIQETLSETENRGVGIGAHKTNAINTSFLLSQAKTCTDVIQTTSTNDIEYPKIISFNPGTVIYTSTSESVTSLDDKGGELDVLPPKQLTTLGVPKMENAEDCHLWPVVEFRPTTSLNGGVARLGNSTTNDPRRQEIHGATSTHHVEQPHSSHTRLRTSDDGILLIISDGEAMTSNVSSNGRMNRGESPSEIIFNQNVAPGANNKLQVFTTEVNGSEYVKQNSRVYNAVNSNDLPQGPILIAQMDASSGTNLVNAQTKPPLAGSILNSLLTSRKDRGRLVSHTSYAASPPKAQQEAKEPNEQVDGVDKWDKLMREVVSLSSAVKGRADPPSQQTSTSAITKDTLARNEPNKELVAPTRDSKEIFIVKYTNGSLGSRVAKVFKARPLFPNDSCEGFTVQNINNSKPILIASSLKK